MVLKEDPNECFLYDRTGSLLVNDFWPPPSPPPSLQIRANITTVQVATILGWWSVGGPYQGLGAADKGMMVTILGLWPQGHNPRMVTIIPLSPGSTQPAVNKIRTRLGGPYPWSFPFDFTIGWLSLEVWASWVWARRVQTQQAQSLPTGAIENKKFWVRFYEPKF